MENGIYLIAAVVVCIACLLLLMFYRSVKSLKLQHSERCDTLNNCFLAHRRQLKERNDSLRAYDFERYNLSQVLQSQPLVSCP
jgi:hypothetical protein